MSSDHPFSLKGRGELKKRKKTRKKREKTTEPSAAWELARGEEERTRGRNRVLWSVKSSTGEPDVRGDSQIKALFLNQS